jgi:very-short-patch-repair endonuclease
MFLSPLGWRVVRFWANEVVQNPEGIWAEIEQVVGARSPHLNSPPRGRGT